MKKNAITGLIVALIISSWISAGEYQKKLDEIRETNGFPGANLSIIMPGGVEINIATGWSDPEHKVKMKPADRMFSGSIGKTYVSAVMLQLIAEGKVTLQDPVENYFKTETWFRRIPNAEKLTINMLMNHTSGLPRHIFNKGFLKGIIKTPEKIWKPAELLSFIVDEKPVHPPAQGWSYSDTNYILIGMIIEKVTGNTYYRELNQRVLIPHNLTATTPANNRVLPGLIQGHTGKELFNFPEKVVVEGKYVVNPQFEWTGGGLITTARDLAKWARLLYTGKVLNPASMKQLLSVVSTETGKKDNAGYGLGVEVWKSDFGPVYGHGGIFPGYQSVMKFYKKYGFSIAMQINEDRTRNKNLKKMYGYIDEFVPIVIKNLEKK